MDFNEPLSQIYEYLDRLDMEIKTVPDNVGELQIIATGIRVYVDSIAREVGYLDILPDEEDPSWRRMAD